MATISKENYLKAIYLLTRENGNRISTSVLANDLCVTNAAISDMANKLSKQGFVEYKKYKGIKILSKGKKIAVDILRKHRIWELFLVETLGYDWGDVHLEAEKLEHCTTNNLIDRIDEYLNFPAADPHGAPIPNKEGNYRIQTDDTIMSECEIGKNYTVTRVNDRNSDLMNYLSQIKISLNKEIKIIDKLNFDNSIIVEIDGINHSLSEILVNNIYLKESKK
ncbi:MAG: metal-dependent transcriptional regulator [Ignavibacteriae bacterium]|nr:metal-dependent transcriptional regulator [Ignavibacteriota bacterium]MCB9210122.1 metal-dependent transcriptional regulator [Ignavibacteriales bacterium]MCB9218493.1 metal-dependent transcriptional regulator [Ignavibacteriales bacterium]MCB9259501.1 metal-dependent transcriptional regulator [Ignavibacteriales bacterium]